jgi:AraC family transcriptional activator of pobA
MAELSLPLGVQDMIKESQLPDVESTVRVFAAHQRSVGARWSYPEHDHPLFELNWVVEGTQSSFIQGQAVVQQQGDIVLIRPGVKHASHADVEEGESMTYFCLHFDIDDPSFRQVLIRSKRTVFNTDSIEAKRIHPILNRLANMSNDANRLSLTSKMRLMSALFELYAALLECLVTDVESDQSIPQQKRLLAERIAQKIEVSFQQSLKKDQTESGGSYAIQHIADQMGYNASYCYRVFLDMYGISPRQYLSSLKLRMAKLLLLNQGMTIDHIAIKLGYKDMSHFSRQFKRWTGTSPNQYRKNLNG